MTCQQVVLADISSEPEMTNLTLFFQVKSVLLKDNLLTGPAFPPTWLPPRAMPYLEILDVSGNRGLTGTLPAERSFFPSAIDIFADRTSLHGTVPSQWCSKATRFQEASKAAPLQEV